MAPTLATPDGQAVETEGSAPLAGAPAKEDIDREFSRAMAAEDPSAVQAPPRHEGQAAAEAPRRRGRPRKNPDEAARAADKAAEVQAVDYVEAAAGVTTLAWATLAAIPYTCAYAAVVDANSANLTAALANGAKHNPKIRAALDKAATGGGGVYALQLAAVGANMAIQGLQIMRDPELRAEAEAATRAKFRQFLAAQGLKLPDEQPAEAADVPAAA